MVWETQTGCSTAYQPESFFPSILFIFGLKKSQLWVLNIVSLVSVGKPARAVLPLGHRNSGEN